MWLGLAALLFFLVVFARVLIGHRVLIGGDNLFTDFPWAGDPAAHRPANFIVSDPVHQFLGWQQLVTDSWRHGRLPLWDENALSGKPLLANDQSAPFSPFTLVGLVFTPAVGLSVAMLVKVWVAGIGMALFLRRLGAGGLAAGAAGIAYSTSSFMVVWLGWPHTAVAALLPWCLWAAEWYLAGGGRRALAVLSVVVGLQFLGGHAETSLHLGFGLAVYCLIRWALGSRRPSHLAGLALAALIGTALAGAQLVPFVVELGHSSLVADRAGQGTGAGHLARGTIVSWLVPNARGNPGIDGLPGWLPNYNETAGFAGVGMLLLSPLGLLWGWRHRRSAAVALGVIGVVAAGVVYGPLSSMAGHLPGLAVANNARMLLLLDLVVAALGGLGIQFVAGGAARNTPVSRIGLWIGGLTLAGLLLGCALVARRGALVDGMLPPLPNGYIGFWVVLGGMAAAAAGSLTAAGLLGRSRLAAGGLALLVLIEGSLFIATFEPQVPLREAPPTNSAITWLQAHAGEAPIAATGNILVPETATLYNLHDVRAYDVVREPRARMYWSAADPRYDDTYLATTLVQPDSRWLAAAGVRYLLTSGDDDRPGTRLVATLDSVSIREVSQPRPFAYLASHWSGATGASESLGLLAADPRGVTALEGLRSGGGDAAEGRARILHRVPGDLDLEVETSTEQALIVLQSYSPDWMATLDGRPVTIHPANVLFQGVLMPAGRHLVHLSYRPPSVAQGMALSAGGLSLVVLMVLPRQRPWELVRRLRAR